MRAVPLGPTGKSKSVRKKCGGRFAIGRNSADCKSAATFFPNALSGESGPPHRPDKPIGPVREHQDALVAEAFHPGSRMVTMRFWQASTGRPLGTPLAHRHYLQTVAFSPNGRIVVAVSYEEAFLYEVATRKPLGEPMRHQARMPLAFDLECRGPRPPVERSRPVEHEPDPETPGLGCRRSLSSRRQNSGHRNRHALTQTRAQLRDVATGRPGRSCATRTGCWRRPFTPAAGRS
jgi:hypothetical protein